MQAVVLAGGKGTRLAGDDAPPKVLTSLCGVPMLDHVLAWLGAHGVRDVVLCTGHRAGEVEASTGDGARFGLSVRACREPHPLGTAGAVRAARDLLGEWFVVAYGDVLADVDLGDLVRAHRASGAVATVAVHPNDHPLDSDRVVADRHGFATRFVRKEDHAGTDAGALCNAALYVLDRSVLDHVPDDRPTDFARDIFPALLAAGARILAWRTAEYIKDMGTPSRATRVEADLRAARPLAMRRTMPRPALLVDRDGVLVEHITHLCRPEDVRLLPGAAASLARANRQGALAICLTNQPVVARGALDEDGLHAIHQRLEGMLGAEGAWLDGIFFCPHHPDRGFAGERADLKVWCECRKPRPGMIFQAEATLGIDRRRSVFVGDDTTDLAAARAAGVVGVGVRSGIGCRDGRTWLEPEAPIVDDLAQAASLLFRTAPSWEAFADRARGVVCIGGASRAGKTLAAAALGLYLAGRGVPVLRVSLDRFILPADRRSPGMPFVSRVRAAEAAQAVTRLVTGESVVVPGYDPLTRRAAPSRMVQWSGDGVLIVDGVTAHALPEAGLAVALVAPPDVLRARRAAFYRWKGLTGAEYEAAVEGHADEAALVADADRRAHIRLTLDAELGLEEVR